MERADEYMKLCAIYTWAIIYTREIERTDEYRKLFIIYTGI